VFNMEYVYTVMAEMIRTDCVLGTGGDRGLEEQLYWQDDG